ncbi:MAG TPA: hopanoid-associated sugar epimerase [Acidimicrobiales bacterium]|nr:hopanoid-associated sugar epimerase [Acidimicrobiales bacterium]
MTIPLGDSDPVCVTGATGFIGSAIVRALVGRGCAVRAMVEPTVDRTNLEKLDVEVVEADVRDGDAVSRALTGIRVVFHTAALYRFWARRPELFYDVNVGGTRNVLAAAAASGSGVVYTSTVGTIGLRADGAPADEEVVADIEHLFGSYKRSKYVAEHETLRHAAAGLPVVITHPTFPLGEGDRAPTPTGQLIVDFLNGRVPAYVNTALNVVDVDDIAGGHLLAAERGRSGRSYILGGENMELVDILGVLADHTGLPRPRGRIPAAAALGAGRASELVQGRLLHRSPAIPMEAARMSTTRMVFDDSRARRELGYTTAAAAEAIRRSADWYVAEGYVRPERLRRMSPTESPDRRS